MSHFIYDLQLIYLMEFSLHSKPMGKLVVKEFDSSMSNEAEDA